MMPDANSPPITEPASALASGWYRGDCHIHSVHSSGGELPPEQLVADARAAGLDFLATTEHNTAETHEAWSRLGGDLLVILGQEVVTSSGHWLALGLEPGQVVGWDYGVDDAVVQQRIAEVHQAGGLCVAAHPHAEYPSGTFMYPYQGFDVVEVWNGLWDSELWWQADNEAALAEWGRGLAAEVRSGWWRPVMGNSDTHLDGQIGSPHTVVAAEKCNASALLAGIRNGHTWIAESAAMQLAFTVSAEGRCAGIGERLDAAKGSAVAQVEVHGVPSGIVTIHTEDGAVHRSSLPANGSGTLRSRIGTDMAVVGPASSGSRGAGSGGTSFGGTSSGGTSSGGSGEAGFVRVEVRHPDGSMAALSNPIIVG